MKGLEIIEHIVVEQVPDSIMICLLLGVFSILIPTFVVYKLTNNGNKAFVAELISGVVYFVFLIVVLVSGVF